MIKKLLKFIIYLLLLCTLVFFVGVFFPATKLPSVGYNDNMYIQNITIVDTESGQLIPAQNILIRNGQITGISSENIRPMNELIILIEGSGKFLIPGLWDMHTQSLKRSPYFHHPLFIANGVTHVRDLSGCLNKNDSYWACTADRKRWFRTSSTGTVITPNYHQNTPSPVNDGSEVPAGFPEYLRADSYEKANALVKFAQSQEADFITVLPQLRRNTYFGIAVESAKNGITLAGNKPITANLQDALATYQRSFEEPWLFAAECFNGVSDLRAANDSRQIFKIKTRQAIIDNQDSVLCSGLMTAMAASQSWWTPSLSQLKASAFAKNASFQENDKNKYIPLVYRFGLWQLQKKKLDLPVENISRNIHKEFLDLAKHQTGLANWAGVSILAGTNSLSPNVYTGFSLHDELDEMVDAGLSTLQALRTATFNPSIFTNLANDYGSIKIGKKADLVVLDANPLDNIRNTKKINAVITNQTYYDREALNKLLEFSEQQAINWHMNIKLVWDAIRSPLMRHQLLKDYASLKDKD